ncbi:MAG: UDP-N-acetylmuramate dehydrogenase [Christensenellales bacterium]
MVLEKAYKKLSGRIADVRRNEPMAVHTSFKVGGTADIMVVPSSDYEMRHAVNTAHKLKIPMLVIGRGTNLLVTSKGLRGMVLKLAENYSGVEINGEDVYVKSGTSLFALVRECISQGLGGAEFLGGIPGTVGGAVYMNAGAYGGEIKDFVKEVYLCAPGGDLSLSNESMSFGYRCSVLQTMPMAVKHVHLRLLRCSAEQSKKKLAVLNEKRREKQPLEHPSAGSTFKRPKGGFAGAMIEQAGLKGLKIGGAEVSTKHAGFIVNSGGATPDDIIELIKLVQARVKEATGILLEPEVKIIGER